MAYSETKYYYLNMVFKQKHLMADVWILFYDYTASDSSTFSISTSSDS